MGVALGPGQSVDAVLIGQRKSRRFRVLNLYSNDLTRNDGDLFSGGSDISLHDASNAFASVERSEIGQLSVGRVRSSGHDVQVREPHSLTLVVPLRGKITVDDGNGCHAARPGGALLTPTGRRATRVEGADGAPFVGIPILLPESAIEEIGRREGPRSTIVINGSRSNVHAQAIRMATLLQEELKNGTGLLDRASAERSWSDLLTEIVADIIDQANGLPGAVDVAGSVSARRVREAVAFMRANLSEITTIADVARNQGISTRALELAFRNEYDVSPMKYLTGLRLSQARRLLTSDAAVESVIDTCLACGIGHAGRFATSYRRRYGESPSETLARR